MSAPICPSTSWCGSLNRSTAMLGTWTESSTYRDTSADSASGGTGLPSTVTTGWLLCSSPSGTGHLLGLRGRGELLGRREQDGAAEPDPERVVDAVGLRQCPPPVRPAVLAVGERRQGVALRHHVDPSRHEAAGGRVLARGPARQLVEHDGDDGADRDPAAGEQGVLRRHAGDVGQEAGDTAPAEDGPRRGVALLGVGGARRDAAAQEQVHRLDDGVVKTVDLLLGCCEGWGP